ncbi:MAG: polysaccharide deacetylase [Eubacterium sp.]|nr:polysaccharide deacetylase [Eubacterium sp.]
MTGDTVEKVSADYRKKRVRRIKRFIVALLLILLILPTCLSVYLILRVNSLEKRLDQLEPEEVTFATGEAVDAVGESDGTSATGSAVTGSSAKEEIINVGEGKKVYLTFDDGPGVNTGKILDILKKNDVKATFFVTGKTDEFSKETYKRIVDEGHTLGMHSYSHVFDEIYASEKAFTRDLDKIYEYLYDMTGVYSKFYRFPGGSSVQQTSVPIERLIDILTDRDISYLDWNVLSPDIRDAGVSKKKMVSEVVSEVAKYDTSVVMFYDSKTQPMTVKALSSIIKALKKDGYELLPIDENTAPIRHNQ